MGGGHRRLQRHGHGDSGVNDTPSEHDIRHAMTRALEATLQRYAGQPYSASALRERITALPGRIEPLGDDWWRVGRIIDTIADTEHDVQCRPPRLRLHEVASPELPPDRPPELVPETPHSRHLKGHLRRGSAGG